MRSPVIATRSPVSASERDLRTLAGIVTDERADVPVEGLPPSLLGELTDLIRCDQVSFFGMDSSRQEISFMQEIPVIPGDEALDDGYWGLHWANEGCSYPERTGDLRSILKVADFYSARQWRSTGIYTEYYRPLGIENDLMLTLPAGLGPAVDPLQSVRLLFLRGPGLDFTERDRALLILLRPHLHQAYLDVERRRHPTPQLTPRQRELLNLVAAGHTNTQIARSLGVSQATVRTHLEHIYGRLHVSSRTAAVTRAFPDRMVG
jgi:DNA-binding CsgD family transcriptional regulator